MSKLMFGVAAIALAIALPAIAQAPQPDQWLAKMPAAPEREMIANACLGCHNAERIVNADHDAYEWDVLVTGMMNVGAPLTQDEGEKVKAYLTKNIPAQAEPKLKLLPGPAKVRIVEWQVPTKGSRPHDPIATKDGSLWYTAQRSSILGKVDMKTGKITEYKTRTPMSGPHGLADDADGNIWYTGNFKSHVGKLDVKTGQFTEYKMPDPKARDPHTPIFDRQGNLWFTLQGANMIGRLNPKNGDLKLVESKTPRSLPYGTVFDTKNQLWIVLFGTNKLAKVDADMNITEYTLPSADSRPRRQAIDADDVIWYADFPRGYIGKFDTKTGKLVKEYMSPSGPKSEPYGITVINGIVWYNEGNAHPNGLVRFDPKTEQFQTFPIPSGGGVVRNMEPTPDGKGIVMAMSAQDKVGVAWIDE
jgi:virginiamycin B lyase